jgi:hypothetical protein
VRPDRLTLRPRRAVSRRVLEIAAELGILELIDRVVADPRDPAILCLMRSSGQTHRTLGRRRPARPLGRWAMQRTIDCLRHLRTQPAAISCLIAEKGSAAGSLPGSAG